MCLMANIFKRGFDAVAEEEQRREKVRELKRGKLFRFYVPKDKVTKKPIKDIPVIFLTEDPINYWEHSVPSGGNFIPVPCIGDGCPHCEAGKPRFVSAWLIVDRTEFSYKDKEGKDVTGKDRIKLLVRGMTDAAILQNKSEKFGLMNFEWTVTKVGTGTSSSMQFERGEKLALTPKQLDAIMSQLPEELRDLDPYEIVEKQILSDLELNSDVTPSSDDSVDAEEVKDKVMEGLQPMTEDDEEEKPSKGKLPRKTSR